MDYKEKYEQVLSKAKDMLNYKEVRREDMEYLFPELKESEDEKIRKEIVRFIQMEVEDEIVGNKWLAWLGKQGDYANFRDKAQVGDRITKNEAGVLVNLSQLNRVAKPEENKGNIGGISANSEWGEEDKDLLYDTLSNLTELKDRYGKDYGNVGKCIDWLKSLRPQNTWKPSEDDIIILEKLIKGELNPKVFQATLQGILEQLKKLKEG